MLILTCLAAGREEGIPGRDGLAPTPATPMFGQVKAQDPADGTVRDHLHRSAHHLSLRPWVEIVSSPRGSISAWTVKPAVLPDLQISREIHHRFGCNGVTSFLS